MLTPGPNLNSSPRLPVLHLAHASPLLTVAETKEESSELPRLGELTVTGVTPDSLRLSWTVTRGPFDSFVILYKDAQGQPQSLPIEGDENEVTVLGLESNRKYKMNLYGLRGRQRVGPVSVVAKTGESEPQWLPLPLAPSLTQGLLQPHLPLLWSLCLLPVGQFFCLYIPGPSFSVHVPHPERLDPSSTLHPAQTPCPSATVYCGLY